EPVGPERPLLGSAGTEPRSCLAPLETAVALEALAGGMPAFDVPAPAERTIDRRPQQAVVIVATDDEREAHQPVLAGARLSRRRTSASATRSAPRPSTARRPSAASRWRSGPSAATRATAAP